MPGHGTGTQVPFDLDLQGGSRAEPLELTGVSRNEVHVPPEKEAGAAAAAIAAAAGWVYMGRCVNSLLRPLPAAK